MIWNEASPDEKREAVRAAIQVQGLSYGQAVKALDAPGRNAIAGVVERSKKTANPIVTTAPAKLAQQRRSASEARKKKAPKPARPKHQGFNQLVPLGPPVDLPVRTISAKAWTALPGSSPIAIEDHKEGCRWPINDDLPFLYCNEALHEGSSYCAAHHKMSFRELPPKTKRRKESA